MTPDHHPYLAAPGPRAFAHRGWHIGDLAGLENSLASFRRAALEGYRYMETDVQVTSDGVVVVHHDRDLDRTTDRTGRVSDLPWSEVRRARIGGTEPISRLEDVLEELPEARFNIDIKIDAALDPFLRVIERTGSLDRVAAASFSTRRLARLRRRVSPAKLATAMSPCSVHTLWLHARVPRVGLSGMLTGLMAQVPPGYGWFELVDDRFVRAAHRLGTEVHVWTINDATRMRTLLDRGVDGIVTDRPDLLREVLCERGRWYGPCGQGHEPCLASAS
ncbi:glycerophosphodiester phosphodiesterase family protein [Haloechinothrix sp. LS1_15]|uniref:glycerophosphodiester phosphodiesterase family protein n=1 Tax=Haloechinothrix sp. LS1_15 TaxID=2652248 RepID=UPI002948AB12|nr:glycerophosphodiester phosphodiesterase family protein [Haloechinothrix sp. LS1_15]MDV6014019.1 glycerophosphodiester phosphodiesterase [Haloechinothrix sp. LS1_15]